MAQFHQQHQLHEVGMRKSSSIDPGRTQTGSRLNEQGRNGHQSNGNPGNPNQSTDPLLTNQETNQETQNQEDVVQTIAELAPWFHNLHLPQGVQTCPDHPLGDFPSYKWAQIAPHLPDDLHGWNVLDIGCNAGFYTLALAQRGARVVGIDVDPHSLRQATWAACQFGLQDQVEFRQMQVYDLAHEDQTYDLVFFMGVFYHLRYPLLGLDIVAEKVERLMVFQTLTMPGDEIYENTHGFGLNERAAMLEPGWPKLAFIEHELALDPTNWWAPNRAAIEALLRSSGMRVTTAPGDEIYLCEPNAEWPSSVATWNRGEILAATGRAHNRQGLRSPS
jgi:tRNA (mo5U34)-methyltransferase